MGWLLQTFIQYRQQSYLFTNLLACLMYMRTYVTIYTPIELFADGLFGRPVISPAINMPDRDITKWNKKL